MGRLLRRRTTADTPSDQPSPAVGTHPATEQEARAAERAALEAHADLDGARRRLDERRAKGEPRAQLAAAEGELRTAEAKAERLLAAAVAARLEADDAAVESPVAPAEPAGPLPLSGDFTEALSNAIAEDTDLGEPPA